MNENDNRLKFGTQWDDNRFNGEKAFRNMQAQFEAAATKNPDELQESFYVFGGRRVRFRVAGRELAEHIGQPFSHLRTHEQCSANPQLTIEIWDSNRATSDGSTPLTSDDLNWTEKTINSLDGRFVGQQLPHTVSCLDREANHIVASIAWNNRIFIYERAKPLARLLLNWHGDQDVQIIHTGLVARQNQGILFVGKSGSGKSTSTLACIMAGFDYLAEDYVGLELCDNGFCIGHSLYNSVFLKTDHLERFPELAPYAVRGRPPQEEKSVVILSQVFPERLKREVPIRALVLPRVVDNPIAQIRAASKAEALLALGPSSLLQIPNRGLGVGGFNKLAQLVESVPCFRLEVGSNITAIPRCLEDLFAVVSSK